MARFRKASIATSIALVIATSIAPPACASSFDGQWNVQITSSSSACGNGATVAIDISSGQVASTDAALSAKGKVAEAGDISVTLSNGIKRAVGSGHLAGSSGSGTWHGALCSGTWTAQRS